MYPDSSHITGFIYAYFHGCLGHPNSLWDGAHLGAVPECAQRRGVVSLCNGRFSERRVLVTKDGQGYGLFGVWGWPEEELTRPYKYPLGMSAASCPLAAFPWARDEMFGPKIYSKHGLLIP